MGRSLVRTSSTVYAGCTCDFNRVDLDVEVEDSNDKLHGKKDLDEEMELEQVAMEDGVNDGFESNVFDDFKF